MKKNNTKKVKTIKNDKYYSEEQREIIRFCVILGVIILAVAIIYFISEKARSKNIYNYGNVLAGTVDYDITSIGSMLNKPYDEYYVAIYNEESAEAVYYSAILNKYLNKKDPLKVYYSNLENKLNEKYYNKKGESNPKAQEVNELSLKEFTFVKVKDGKIVKYLESIEDVRKELSV